MSRSRGVKKYYPGMYAKIRANAAQMADRHFMQLEQRRKTTRKATEGQIQISNCISFSRKIGVGALEIADILTEKLGISVVDREILEYMVQKADVKSETVAAFDERYTGVIKNVISMFVNEKSFMMEDYLRHLTAAVYSIAEEGPIIFVGRATHLLLPRDKTLAVRFISSVDYRIKRLMKILGVNESEAKKILNREDKYQRDFFKKSFGIKDVTPYEFDMVINCDFCKSHEAMAEIVAKAYQMKFGW